LICPSHLLLVVALPPQAGNATLGFNVNTDWATMKPQAPFGQLPVLTVPAATAWASSPYARSGDEACANIGQTTAIINYIGKTAGTEGDTAESFATSQQLLAEGEDLYLLGTKSLPTVYKRLSDPASGIITSKGTASDYATFWATILPAHLARLNRLCRGGSFQPPSRTAAQYLPGELYLWNVLYQFHMIDPSVSFVVVLLLLVSSICEAHSQPPARDVLVVRNEPAAPHVDTRDCLTPSAGSVPTFVAQMPDSVKIPVNIHRGSKKFSENRPA
jgi:hypothetical protein